MTDNSWMLKELVDTPGVRHVIVSSADGLVKIYSDSLDRDEADRLAATGAGQMALSADVGRTYGTGGRAVRQVMIDFEGGVLFIRVAGEGSRLAVVTTPTVDPKVVSQQMQTVIKRLGAHTLSTPARS